MASKIVKEETKDFLLAEYQLLREMRDRVITRGEERIRFYFSLFSGTGALLALLPQFFNVADGFYIVILVVAGALLILGILTLERLISGHISARIYTRGINRIRRYFVDNDKSITKYLILPVTDDIPEVGIIGFNQRKGASTGNVSIMIYMNTILLVVMAIVLLIQFFEVEMIYSLIIAAILTPVSILFHFRYYRNQIRRIHNKIEINFPQKVNVAPKS